ncbi:DUF2513 domain-containing protein [Lentilactobacillus buchneri]|nr:DUF2513 domain-containing protein [Lentilactobacillus buchneri]
MRHFVTSFSCILDLSQLIEVITMKLNQDCVRDIMLFIEKNVTLGMLTWDGHKFLDTIRDSKVWSTTKSVTEKLASVSMSMIESISAQVISNIIKSQMIKNGF